jgi:hypothetical protein
VAGWVRCSRGRPTYTRITRAPFTAWADTPHGRAVVAAVAGQIRFSLLGKERAARRRLWRGLAGAARDERIAAVLQTEVDAYLGRLSQLAYGDGLPRSGVNLHRLVVVPRVLLNSAAYRSIQANLGAHPAIASLEGGDALRDFFFLRLIREIHTAIVQAEPSPKRPLAAGDDWISVGVNTNFVWRVPFNAPAWAGHHYVLELTRDPITRTLRKAVAQRISDYEASLPKLSKVERVEILRRATSTPD